MNTTLPQLTNIVEKIRPWPWRHAVLVLVGSFLAASVVSSAIGFFMMGQTGKTTNSNQDAMDGAPWSQGPTLTKAQVDQILERNIFNSQGQIGDIDPDAVVGNQAMKTTLPIKVIGIIYTGNPLTGLAMIENTEKKTINSFLVGDLIAPDAPVAEVHIDQILIDNNGRREFAPLDEIEIRRSTRAGKKQKTTPSASVGISQASSDSYKEEGFERKGSVIEMTQEYKTRLLTTEFSNVLQDAKASPNMVDGTLRGFRMDKIRPGSLYDKAGLQNNDVVEEINGVVLSDVSQSVKLLQSLRNESEIEIRVNRSGAPTNLVFKVR
jgi:type II secretion system protein C